MIQTLFGSVEQEPSLLDRLKSGVEKTRAGLVSRLEDALAGKKEIDAELLDELEYTLISADIGVKTTGEILERIRQQIQRLRASGSLQDYRNRFNALRCKRQLPARIPPAIFAFATESCDP